jgi:CBS-domain-containing membrane protein
MTAPSPASSDVGAETVPSDAFDTWPRWGGPTPRLRGFFPGALTIPPRLAALAELNPMIFRPGQMAGELPLSSRGEITMHIKDIMSHPAVTCPAASTLDHAARLMWEFDCGIIPVVDDEGRLTGVITDRDICMAAYTQGRPIATIPVTTAMASHAVAVHGDDVIEQAEELMRENQIRRLPVLDGNGRPIGLVSMNDLARLAAQARKSGVDRELVRTLAAVCKPREKTPVSARETINRPQLVG